MTYSIYRNTTLIATVNPTGTQSKRIMGGNTVDMSFTLPDQTAFEVGDYADVYGERYYINYPPQEKEQSSIRWEYNLTLQVAQYDLAKVTYFGYNASNVLTLPDHDLTGTADVFIDLLLANLNRKGAGGYSKGTIDVTDTQTLQFTGENCLAVLSRLAEVFKTEYWIEGKVIHLSKRGEVLPITLKYGQGNGLRKIERVPVDENPPVTMLFVYGGTKNLPLSYRGGLPRLQLPVSGAPLGYLSNSIPNFENEAIYINENIFPERTGVVSASGAINSFSDSGLDFDINSQLIPGVSAKVKFITGSLSGYEFEISSYNASTKTITFNENKDEKAFTVPSESQRPAIGDKWVLFDVTMPQSYIDAAEARLLADGLEYKEQNTGNKYNFNLTTDSFHFERTNATLGLGKYLTLVSEEWDVNGVIRIIGYTRDLQHPYQYPSVEVSHNIRINPAVVADTKQRDLVKDVEKVKKVTSRVGNLAYKSLVEKALLGETIIEGGYILTELIDVVTLIVQNLITGKVRITAEDNNIRIVEPDTGSGEKDLVVIDDDSAIESVYMSSTPPTLDLDGNPPKNYINSKVIGGVLKYFYSVLGAGISVGVSPTHAGGYSSLGRKEITTNGAVKAGNLDGNSNQSVMDSNGFRTTGTLNTGGDAIVGSLKSNGEVKVMDGATERTGLTVSHDVRVGGTAFYEMKWVNGVLVSSTLKP